MVRRSPALALGVVLEHGEIGDPEPAIGVRVFAVAGEKVCGAGIFFARALLLTLRRRCNGVVVLLYLWLYSAFRCARRAAPAGDDY